MGIIASGPRRRRDWSCASRDPLGVAALTRAKCVVAPASQNPRGGFPCVGVSARGSLTLPDPGDPRSLPSRPVGDPIRRAAQDDQRDGGKDPLRKSCDYCARMKRACDGLDPCALCLRRRKECTRSIKRKSGPAKGAKYAPRRNKRDLVDARPAAPPEGGGKLDKARGKQEKAREGRGGTEEGQAGGQDRKQDPAGGGGSTGEAHGRSPEKKNASSGVVRQGTGGVRGRGAGRGEEEGEAGDGADGDDGGGRGEAVKEDRGRTRAVPDAAPSNAQATSRSASRPRSSPSPLAQPAVPQRKVPKNKEAGSGDTKGEASGDGGSGTRPKVVASRETTVRSRSPQKLPHVESPESSRWGSSKRNASDADAAAAESVGPNLGESHAAGLAATGSGTRRGGDPDRSSPHEAGLATMRLDPKRESVDRDAWGRRSPKKPATSSPGEGMDRYAPSPVASPKRVPSSSPPTRASPPPPASPASQVSSPSPARKTKRIRGPSAGSEAGRLPASEPMDVDEEEEWRPEAAPARPPKSGGVSRTGGRNNGFYHDEGDGYLGQKAPLEPSRRAKSPWSPRWEGRASSERRRPGMPGSGDRDSEGRQVKGGGEAGLPPLAHFWDRSTAVGRRADEIDRYVRRSIGQSHAQSQQPSVSLGCRRRGRPCGVPIGR